MIAPPRWLITAGSSAAGLLLLAMVNLRAIPPILLLSVGVGVPVLLADVSMDTLLLQYTGDAYRGRVLGAYGMSGALVMLASVIVAGVLGEHSGIVRLLDAASVLLVAAGLAALLLLPRLSGRKSRAGARPPDRGLGGP